MTQNESETKRTNSVKTLFTDLSQSLRGNAWQDVLQACALMGVIDNLQLVEMTGLGRDALFRLVGRMSDLAIGYPPLFQQIQLKTARGKMGPSPKIFCLKESGAAILRQLGEQRVLPYQESNPIAILHDLCIVDLFLAAKKDHKETRLEERIYFRDSEYLLPDVLIQLDNEIPALFEIEQAVHPNYLRRMAEGLRRRLDFFQSDAGRMYSPLIRMLINLPPGSREMETALDRWRHLFSMLSTQNGSALPFQILVMPLQSFLDAPDWTVQPDNNRWHDLSTPAKGSHALAIHSSQPPSALMGNTSHEDALVLEALWQWFEENEPQQRSDFPMPDPHFLEVISLIYLASHQLNSPPLQQAAFPYASVFLLRKYLTMHPDLRQLLEKTIERGEHSIRWNPTTILSRMQSEMDVFLNYHGWSNRDQLIVSPTVSSWEDEGTKNFGVKVQISSGEVLMSESDGVVPGKSEIQAVEKMLGWVLWALIAYADQIGLPERGYW